jgi:hypothetical protein
MSSVPETTGPPPHAPTQRTAPASDPDATATHEPPAHSGGIFPTPSSLPNTPGGYVQMVQSVGLRRKASQRSTFMNSFSSNWN